MVTREEAPIQEEQIPSSFFIVQCTYFLYSPANIYKSSDLCLFSKPVTFLQQNNQSSCVCNSPKVKVVKPLFLACRFVCGT